jgi:hypothetical protein
MTVPSPDDSVLHDGLIRGLAADLRPVRRLPSPGRRALAWLAAVLIIALGLALLADLPALGRRLVAAPDLLIAVASSILTAVLAAIAAFQLSLPDGRRAWALLPLPAALLWIIASGIGCLRSWTVADTHAAALDEARDCLLFILAVSIPLSALLIVMLRRACSLQPGLTAIVAGLAAAAAAATLLNFFHPFDAAATDLVVHVAAVALVVGANRVLGGRLLAPANSLYPDVTRAPAPSKGKAME